MNRPENVQQADYGPVYRSGRPRIVSYRNDDAMLYLGLKMPDGAQVDARLVLPNATPAPGEFQLTQYAMVGRTAYGYDHLRHFVLYFSQNGRHYKASYDADDINRFQWFLLPLFRPLYPYEVENLKKWGYTK